MATKNFYNECSNVVVVNGITMLLKEYKEYKRKQLGIKPKKREKKINIMALDADEIKRMLKSVRTMKSFNSYYKNGYRQWGTAFNDIVKNNYLDKHFVRYAVKYREIDNLVKEINEIASKSEKAVYQKLEQLSWKIDDIIAIIDSLTKEVSKQNVCQRYKDEKCIFERGRRLGLRVILSRTFKAICDLQTISFKCKDISKSGVNPFEYSDKVSNGIINTFYQK